MPGRRSSAKWLLTYDRRAVRLAEERHIGRVGVGLDMQVLGNRPGRRRDLWPAVGPVA